MRRRMVVVAMAIIGCGGTVAAVLAPWSNAAARPAQQEPQDGATATVGPCSHAQLAITTGPWSAGMNSMTQFYDITNEGGSCTLGGTPSVGETDAATGAAVSGVTGNGSFPLVGIGSAVTLASGGEASFSVSSQGCSFDPSVDGSRAAVTSITLPGVTSPFLFSEHGRPQCSSEVVTAGPLEQGTTLPQGYVIGPPSTWNLPSATPAAAGQALSRNARLKAPARAKTSQYGLAMADLPRSPGARERAVIALATRLAKEAHGGR